jgi:flagellum-specific ATP synthase
MIARFDETRDLRVMGGYKVGEDPELDRSVELVPKLYAALQQTPRDPVSVDAFQEVARQLSS